MTTESVSAKMLANLHPSQKEITAGAIAVKPPTACDCRARNAFHEFREQDLTPAFNVAFTFTIPAKCRVVIEFVTATVVVPAGEMARLRLSTGLGQTASNLDLTLTPQGIVNSQQILVATHRVRAYADSLLQFNVNRDNSATPGHALICISGYLEPI
ncbi:MAG TPA: hypothetical protein VG649_23415 [Candidatus Angelobacter sp.]|jgi:hypothetical protein|nr:hypothetical protein [Candidatus Angelobacter sp.]